MISCNHLIILFNKMYMQRYYAKSKFSDYDSFANTAGKAVSGLTLSVDSHIFQLRKVQLGTNYKCKHKIIFKKSKNKNYFLMQKHKNSILYSHLLID